VHLRVAGALDSLAIGGLGQVKRLAIGDWRVPAAELRGQLEPGPVPLIWLDVTADSIASGSLGFGAARAVHGPVDSSPGGRARASAIWAGLPRSAG
jgi:hypothetical protein